MTVETIIEAIYRAQSIHLGEDEIGLTLMSEDGVQTWTLRELREMLAVVLCREVPSARN